MTRNPLVKVCVAIGVLFLFVGTNTIPSSSGYSGRTKTCVFQMSVPSSVNETITDYIGDVCSVNYTTQETTIVTSHPDIDVVNLDIVQTTYTQQETQATLSVQVVGIIEDRGILIGLYEENFTDLNFVEYDFQVSTSEQDYSISYCNQTGQLYNGIETINLTSSDFSVAGDTLIIWFSLLDSEETYRSLSASSMFVKMNLSSGNLSEFVYLTDIVPNPPLEIMEVYAPETGYVGKTVQFHASIIPLTGLPPYTYHWDFGDQGTSTELNPTHVYTEPGFYMYTFSVTDAAGGVAYNSGFIVIYELKKTFVFGRYANWTTEDNLNTVDAVGLWTLQFEPFKLERTIAPDTIRFSDDWVGIRTQQWIIGVFEIVLEFTY